jgi:hypothetical protein
MCDYNMPKALDAFVKMGNNMTWRRSAYTDGKYAISVMGNEFDIVCDEFTDGYTLECSHYQPDQTVLDALHKCIVSNKS